jgi:hypothetical protein
VLNLARTADHKALSGALVHRTVDAILPALRHCFWRLRLFRVPKGAQPMRTALLIPIAAAVLASAAIATWGPGVAGPRAAVTDRRPPSAASSGPTSQVAVSSTSQLPVMAAPRYRAEACTGDYICGADGAWEPIARVPADNFTQTSDGF